MTTHYNPSITERAARILNSKSGDFLSDDVAGPVATIPITPNLTVATGITRTTTGAGTIYTTPADKDFYLVAMALTTSKNVTCDVSAADVASIRAVINGVTTTILNIAGQTLVGEQNSISIALPFPLKIDRGSIIQIGGGTFAAGALSRSASIYGYTEEVTKSQ